MAKYQHQKGIVQNNALQALLHDRLFRQRIERNEKGKGSYRRKPKYESKMERESGDKKILRGFLSPLFC